MYNIIIADHQAIFRAGIAKVLAVEEDLRIVAQPQSPEQLLTAADKLHAHVLLISTGYINLFQQLQQLVAPKRTGILVLAENTETASTYLRLGAQGVVYRSVNGETMVDAVRRVARGEGYVQSAGASSVDAVNEDFVGARVRDRLSTKELRIVAAIVQGYRNREIAGQLGTTEQVIKNSLRNIYDKIGVSDRLELALFVLHHHLLAEAAAAVPMEGGRSAPPAAQAG